MRIKRMTTHVDAFHFHPLFQMDHYQKLVESSNDLHLSQTFVLLQFYHFVTYFNAHRNAFFESGRGASAQRVPPKWLREGEIVLFFSSTVCLRINLLTLLTAQHPQKKIGEFQIYSQPFSFKVSIRPSTLISLHATESQRSLSDVILGLIFWCQHEYTITDICVSNLLSSTSPPSLRVFLRNIYKQYPHVSHHIVSTMVNKHESSHLLQHIKVVFQDELRSNGFLKSTLGYFRSWPSIHHLPSFVRDASQAKIRQFYRFAQLQPRQKNIRQQSKK